MIELIRACVLISVVLACAPRVIREMEWWQKQTPSYRKRTVHEFVRQEGSMHEYE